MTALVLFVKASLLLSVVALVQALLARRASAATRHLIWTLAVIAVLLLPLFSVALPGWTAISLAPPRMAAPASRVESPPTSVARLVVPEQRTPTTTPRGGGLSWSIGLAIVYGAGVLLLLARLAVLRLSIERVARRALEVSDPEWIRLMRQCSESIGIQRAPRLLRTHEETMPLAFGVWRGVILIPAVAGAWSEDRRRAVLLHELAHVARYDCLTQMLAAVACAIYWMHPGVWWMARRLRVERELACDDRVLSAGASARDYARHLLELAYALHRELAPALTLGMAGSRHLEGRLIAVLDAARNRRTPTRRVRAAGVALMTGLLVPVSAATTAVDASSGNHEQAAPATADPVLAALAQIAATGSDVERLVGLWELEQAAAAGHVHLRLCYAELFSSSELSLDRLEGYSAAPFPDADGPIRFTLRRDAGVFSFEGIIENASGEGVYIFTPAPSFAADLERRGLERPTASEQLAFAQHDVGFAMLDKLEAQGASGPDLADVIGRGQRAFVLLASLGQPGHRSSRGWC